MSTRETRDRLDYLRNEIEAERISMEEILELEGLADEIPDHDVVLLEWAGVPEGGREVPEIPELLELAEGLIAEIRYDQADTHDVTALLRAVKDDEIDLWAQAHIEGHNPGVFCSIFQREAYA